METFLPSVSVAKFSPNHPGAHAAGKYTTRPHSVSQIVCPLSSSMCLQPPPLSSIVDRQCSFAITGQNLLRWLHSNAVHAASNINKSCGRDLLHREPRALGTVFRGQDLHSVEPSSVAAVPFAHGVQGVLPVGLKYPGLHTASATHHKYRPQVTSCSF
jgi:hypothetical protein